MSNSRGAINAGNMDTFHTIVRRGMTGSCFRCGAPGHRNTECDRPPNCPICTSRNFRSDHVAGGSECRSMGTRFYTGRGALGAGNH